MSDTPKHGGTRPGSGRKPKPDPKSKISISLNPYILDIARGYADRQGVKLSQVIERWMIEGLDRDMPPS